MSLNVVQGPLPPNGAKVDASSFLEEWVNGTRIFNIPLSSFELTFNFITSQTDAPEDRRGLVWFERGVGKLWLRDDPDRGDSRYTGAVWCQLGPTRETMVEVMRDVPAGRLITGPDHLSAGNMFAFYRDVNDRQTRRYFGTAGAFTRRMFAYHYISASSTPSGYAARAVEWGFTPMLACSGFSQAAGMYARTTIIDDFFSPATADSPFAIFSRSANYSGETNYFPVGLTAYGTGATAQHMTTIFKRPTMDFVWYT